MGVTSMYNMATKLAGHTKCTTPFYSSLRLLQKILRASSSPNQRASGVLNVTKRDTVFTASLGSTKLDHLAVSWMRVSTSALPGLSTIQSCLGKFRGKGETQHAAEALPTLEVRKFQRKFLRAPKYSFRLSVCPWARRRRGATNACHFGGHGVTRNTVICNSPPGMR